MLMSKKDIAESFLKLASAGHVTEAFEKYVHPLFRHHNAYFRGDRQTLIEGMIANATQFPNKKYETVRMIEEGDMVVVQGKVTLTTDSQWSVIHIFRFEGELIIEEWEASQQVLSDSPNENGIF